MKTCITRILLAVIVLHGVSSLLVAASVLTTRIGDPRAVYLEAPGFKVQGDGVADDSAAIQAAIDRAANSSPGESIVFIPSGRYRIVRTIFIWSGVRVYGYGQTRPVFVLADNTPGYQDGIGLMVMFSGSRPRPAAGAPSGRGGEGPTRSGDTGGRAGAVPNPRWNNFRARFRSLPRSVPSTRYRPGQRLHLGRQPRHILLRYQQCRFRNRQR
jgi:hypothetical protein